MMTFNSKFEFLSQNVNATGGYVIDMQKIMANTLLAKLNCLFITLL